MQVLYIHLCQGPASKHVPTVGKSHAGTYTQLNTQISTHLNSKLCLSVPDLYTTPHHKKSARNAAAQLEVGRVPWGGGGGGRGRGGGGGGGGGGGVRFLFLWAGLRGVGEVRFGRR